MIQRFLDWLFGQINFPKNTTPSSDYFSVIKKGAIEVVRMPDLDWEGKFCPHKMVQENGGYHKKGRCSLYYSRQKDNHGVRILCGRSFRNQMCSANKSKYRRRTLFNPR